VSNNYTNPNNDNKRRLTRHDAFEKLGCGCYSNLENLNDSLMF